MLLSLPFPLIDTERMTPTGGGGGRVSVKVWVAVALVLLTVAWQLVRVFVLQAS